MLTLGDHLCLVIIVVYFVFCILLSLFLVFSAEVCDLEHTTGLDYCKQFGIVVTNSLRNKRMLRTPAKQNDSSC